MSAYRLWQVKRGAQISGPFPEPLICQQILLGRIRENDLLSLDGHSWHDYRDIPEIYQEITRLLDLHAESHDPQWHEERVRAALRHFDERKSPDRRDHDNTAETEALKPRREGHERRLTPETVEQHTYRQHVAEVDSWLRRYRLRYGWAAAVLLAATLAIGLALHFFQATTPIDIGLQDARTCDRPPARGVEWHGCNKSGYLLAGADLRQANLTGTDFSGANLSYADLTGARLEGALFKGTILTGATWADGRICASGSVGLCR